MIYFLLKFIHILSVITALGANLTYGFLLAQAEREPKHLMFMLKTIQWLDRNVANRAYMLVLISGLLLVWRTGYSFSTLWIWTSLSLFVLVAFLGITVYAPVIRKQLALVESNQTNTAEYRSIRKKSNTIGILVTLMVIVILLLMVTKPV